MPSFVGNLNRISRCTQMQRGGKLKKYGICGGQVPYLLRLCRFPGLSQEEVARALYVNKSTAARQIANLEKAGLVERRPSEEDRRKLLVYPTQRALELQPEIREMVVSWNSYLLEEFSEEEQALLQSMMDRVACRAQAYIEREVGWDG